jgi:hypothetical protein
MIFPSDKKMTAGQFISPLFPFTGKEKKGAKAPQKKREPRPNAALFSAIVLLLIPLNP